MAPHPRTPSAPHLGRAYCGDTALPGDQRRGVAHRGLCPLFAPQEGVEARCARFLFFVFCAHGAPGTCGAPVSSRASRSGGGAAPAGKAGRAARPHPAAPGERPTGTQAKCPAHLNPGAKRPRAKRAGSPHNARRKRARRAKCAGGTSPAHRLALPPPCASRGASEGNRNRDRNPKPAALRTSTRGPAPAPRWGLSAPRPPSNWHRAKAIPKHAVRDDECNRDITPIKP